MRIFLRKSLTFFIILFFILEFISRLIFDPLYFQKVDRYHPKLSLINSPTTIIRDILDSYKNKQLKHIDYLFIGSSRMWASIDASLFTKECDTCIAINASYGGMTPSIEYFALKKLISENKNVFNNSIIFLEYPRKFYYCKNFNRYKYQVNEKYPFRILPYLTTSQLFDFLKYSQNSFPTKMKIFFAYYISSYRTFSFVRHYWSRFTKKVTDYLFGKQNKELFPAGGGINQNIKNSQSIKRFYDEKYDQERKELVKLGLLTEKDYNESFLNKFYQLLTSLKAKIIFIDLPLYSKNKEIYQEPITKQNLSIFEKWLKERNILLLRFPEFKYNDKDFPDYSHISIDKRKYFSILLYNELNNFGVDSNKVIIK